VCLGTVLTWKPLQTRPFATRWQEKAGRIFFGVPIKIITHLTGHLVRKYTQRGAEIIVSLARAVISQLYEHFSGFLARPKRSQNLGVKNAKRSLVFAARFVVPARALDDCYVPSPIKEPNPVECAFHARAKRTRPRGPTP